MFASEAMKILGVSDGFTQEELKKKYRRLAAQNHPDTSGTDSTEKFIQINKAYELLSSSRKISSKIIFTHGSIFKVVKNN